MPPRSVSPMRPLAALAIAALGAIASPSASAALACDVNALASVAPLNVTLTGASIKNTGLANEYCDLRGTIGPAPSVIKFVVALPKNWNGRFLSWGDGGFDGNVDNPPSNRIAQGYAIVNTDSGHSVPATRDAAWAYNNRTAEIDYGYRAVKVGTQVGKRITQAFYRGRIEYSYFEGCSTGGRQALMAAQRYPEEFDGIVGGAPAHNLTGLAIEQNWSLRQFTLAAPTSNPPQTFPAPGAITPAQASAINAAVLAKCDAADGVKDGLLTNPLACSFKASELACGKPGVDPATCLSPAQVTAVQNVYDGPRTSWGKRLYPGKPVGSESGWPVWLLPGIAGQGGFSFSFMNYLFFPTDPGPSYKFTDFNFDTDPPQGRLMASILDAVDPDLSEFRRQGGKFILYHGFGDGLIPPQRTIQYYEAVLEENHSLARTQKFMRFFLAPGMDHCGSIGGGLKDWDRLEPLVNWVEKGIAPERIVASQSLGAGKTRTRPLCPYPSEAKWTGSGSSDDAANFECVMPRGARGYGNERSEHGQHERDD